MCGIAGFYGFRNDDLLKVFSKQLAHRGPDGSGFDFTDNISLLNRRLAIIDLKSGDQPVYNEDRTVAVVFNGEIYNYQELRDQLKRRGHKFKTKSDTEVIVHGYEEWGIASFDKYNGMFAIAINDKRSGQLILARDHFGIKPLYYSVINGKKKKVVFASEIKPIIASGLTEKKPNNRIIFRYLKYRVHDDQRETFFSGVNRLLPGEVMVLQKNTLKISKYTTLEEDLLNESEREFSDSEIKIFRKKLTESIKLRLISDVSVGSALSGGLDSSTVVATIANLLGKKAKAARSVGRVQKSFSAVFPGSSNDEEAYVDALIDAVKKVESHKVYPSSKQFLKDLKDFVRTQEEPTISTGPYAQYCVMKEARRHVKVLLDGQGADEMMAGYLPYYMVYFRELQKKEQANKLIWEGFKARDVLEGFFLEKTAYSLGKKDKIEPTRLLKKNFSGKYAKEKYAPPQDNLKARLVDDIFRGSLPSLLRYEDKNSMRFSIEGRVPFLDKNLLRYIFSLSNEAIIKDGWNKNILRSAVKGLLPEEIRKRRNKIGFTTPEYEWFKLLTPEFYKVFLSEEFKNREYFDQPKILKAFQAFIDRKSDDTMLFWRMISVELWLREFIDPPKEPVKTKYRPLFPNEGKKIKLVTENANFYRFPIRTELIKRGQDFSKIFSLSVRSLLDIAFRSAAYKTFQNKKWFVVVSEKSVAIAQGRSYFLWEVQASYWARLLSKKVTKSPYGIGLASPFTMELAIREVGLPRLLFASSIALLTKPFGIRGAFYNIAGAKVRAIDGPTEYSLYPANASATLGPKDPNAAAGKIAERIKKTISKKSAKNFQGVVIIDANDIGRNVLGNTTAIADRVIEGSFRDNPLGQGAERTPLAVVFIDQ